MGFSSLPKALPPWQTRVRSYTPRTSWYLGPGRGETAANKKPQLVRAPWESGRRSQEPWGTAPSSWVTTGTHSLVPAVPALRGYRGQKPTRQCQSRGTAHGAAGSAALTELDSAPNQRGPYGSHPAPTDEAGVSHRPLICPQQETAPNWLTIDPTPTHCSSSTQLDYNELARLQHRVNYTSRGKLRGAFTIIFKASGSS